MNRLTDSRYLRSQQYSDSSNLNARQRLHMLYSTNQTPWFEWVFDRFDFKPGCHILELGCGPGDLWLENLSRLPPDAQIYLSDFSPGMLSKAGCNLKGKNFRFTCLDAQNIPFPTGWFDAIIANHMLYHLPDLDAGLHEIWRVLQPGGRLYAATNGERHMQEVYALESLLAPAANAGSRVMRTGFTLENGHEILAKRFVDVRMLRFKDSLRVTEPGHLADYILSMSVTQIREENRSALTQIIEAEMARQGGVFQITKDPGIFTAGKRRHDTAHDRFTFEV